MTPHTDTLPPYTVTDLLYELGVRETKPKKSRLVQRQEREAVQKMIHEGARMGEVEK